jgi:hypothetical protein
VLLELLDERELALLTSSQVSFAGRSIRPASAPRRSGCTGRPPIRSRRAGFGLGGPDPTA